MSDGEEHRKELVRKQFGRNARKYVESEGHANGPDLGEIVNWLSPSMDWMCLDIATGGGHVARTLSSHAGMVVASDLTMKMLEAARVPIRDAGLKNVLFVLADAESLPFMDSTFDAVTCRIAPHHFPDKALFVSESSRVLKEGGKFLVVDNVTPEDPELADYMNTFESLRDPSHVSCASPAEWKELIAGSGMEVARMSSRKKTYRFRSWAERTAESEGQIESTERMILSGEQRLREYYGVVVQDDHVVSLQVDEMMIMAIRR